ncbi:unnamed protein product [Nezara viridula]|uniref:Neuropeptide n=1 Tax=Nezara viridula TaxID=85310 RepID=A0A9P0HSY8_NEZVI|nr:unnamed protein product [Nezara viridula]
MYKLVILSALVAMAFASYGDHESHEQAYSSQKQVNYVKDSVIVEIKVMSDPVDHHVPEVHHVPVIHHVETPYHH